MVALRRKFRHVNKLENRNKMNTGIKIRIVLGYLLLITAYVLYFSKEIIGYGFVLIFAGFLILISAYLPEKEKKEKKDFFLWRKRIPRTAEVTSYKKTAKQIAQDLDGIKEVWEELEEDEEMPH